MQPLWFILYKLAAGIIGAGVFALVSFVVCLPYLFAAPIADKEEYWSSFWWRAKRAATVGGAIGGLIGVCLIRWQNFT